jgi:hypothetical protein
LLSLIFLGNTFSLFTCLSLLSVVFIQIVFMCLFSCNLNLRSQYLTSTTLVYFPKINLLQFIKKQITRKLFD